MIYRNVQRQADAAFEIAVEPDDDAQQRRLTASGWADNGRDLSVCQCNRQVAEHMELSAGGGAKRLVPDMNIKLAWCASGRHVVQRADPEAFR